MNLELIKGLAANMQVQSEIADQAMVRAAANTNLISALAKAVFQKAPEARQAMEDELRLRLSEAATGDNLLSKQSSLLALQLMGFEPFEQDGNS